MKNMKMDFYIKGGYMNKKENIKYSNLPIINKGKMYNKKNSDTKNSRFLTIVLIIFIIILLLFCGYSMAKTMEEFIIKGKAEIAQPIFIVENNPSIDITALNNIGTYTFKVKNYNEQNEVTQTALKYYIEILANTDNSINIELYQNENKINLTNNKTEYIEISKDKKEEREYKIKITYDKNQSNTINDIMEKIQVRVHTEQVKA